MKAKVGGPDKSRKKIREMKRRLHQYEYLSELWPNCVSNSPLPFSQDSAPSDSAVW